jgi:disulfide bond formation protein DsbB
MPKITTKHLLILLSFYSALALAGAYVSQYFFGLQPCILCLYQRVPFFLVIFISLIGVFFLHGEKIQKYLIFTCLAVLLANAGIAGYHTGVEKKIFKGPTTCVGGDLNQAQTLEELDEMIKKSRIVKCSEPAFVFLGLSMASWNMLYCLMIVFCTASLLLRKNLPLFPGLKNHH